MITKANLIAARARIADSRNWTTHAFGRNAEGLSLTVRSDGFAGAPVCYCLIGAVLDELPPQPLWRKLEIISSAFDKTSTEITAFNDRSTHAEVLEYLDQLIKETSDAQAQ